MKLLTLFFCFVTPYILAPVFPFLSSTWSHQIPSRHCKRPARFCGIATHSALSKSYGRGTQWRSWLTYCATSRKFAGSIPEGVIGTCHWRSPSGRTTVMGWTQSLTVMLYMLGVNPLALELDIFSLAHHLWTMWIFYEPRRITLGDTWLFVEERRWWQKV